MISSYEDYLKQPKQAQLSKNIVELSIDGKEISLIIQELKLLHNFLKSLKN
jgi:hypothetical protein